MDTESLLRSLNVHRVRYVVIGYDVSDLTVAEMLEKKILFRQYILDVDIYPDVLGVTFAQVWRNKVRKRFGKTTANFAGLDDLIKMKRAAKRPKDREDLKVLRALKKQKRTK
jgi:hypothetical protein